MEKVFPVSVDSFLRNGPKNVLSGDLSKREATIEKVVGEGRYLISLRGGGRLTALGPSGLEKGSRVQVEPLTSENAKTVLEKQLGGSPSKGDQWLARFPVRLVSGTAEARLDVHVEPGSQNPFAKNEPVVHLVFSMKTATYGDIQWSLYLRRNEVLARVYIEKLDASGSGASQIIKEFEDSLKKKGFSLLAPTVILKRPFKVSAGLQLNLQG